MFEVIASIAACMLIAGIIILVAFLFVMDLDLKGDLDVKWNVTLYTTSGIKVGTWLRVDGMAYDGRNSGVQFVDAKGKDQLLSGTIVCETFHGPGPGDEPKRSEKDIVYSVKLFGSNNEPIRSWLAINVDALWPNDRVEFIDYFTAKKVVVFGTYLIDELRTPETPVAA